MKRYKVWVGVEEHDEDAERPQDEFTDMDLSFPAEREFDTVKEATEFAGRLHDVSQAMLALAKARR